VSRLDDPFGVAADAAGDVYFVEYGSSTLKKWSAATRQVTTLASSSLFLPVGVAVDRFGNIYVADYGNHAVEMFITRRRHAAGRE
jgi:DNA-binding beta-propeller fold protein YncE